MILNKSAVLMSFSAMMALAGCSGSGDGDKSKEVLNGDKSQYAAASCKYQYSEGPIALTQSAREIQIAAFDKKLNIALMKPVLGASGAEVVRFAENTGVRYYKTDAHKLTGTCEFAASLPAAPYDIQRRFNDSSFNDVLGLYLPKNSKDQPSTSDEAAITVRKDANKWVLVHEYMHHLFEIESKEDKSGDDVKTSITNLMKQYQSQETSAKYAYNIENKKLYVGLAAQSLIDLNKDMVVLLKHFYLEEMTIEGILSSKLDSGELTLVVKGQRLNGAAYTILSAKKSMELIDSLKTEISDFTSKYSTHLGSAQYYALAEATKKLRAIENQMNELKSKARSVLSAEGLEYNGIHVVNIADQSVVDEGEIGCSHSKSADDILEQVKTMGQEN